MFYRPTTFDEESLRSDCKRVVVPGQVLDQHKFVVDGGERAVRRWRWRLLHRAGQGPRLDGGDARGGGGVQRRHSRGHPGRGQDLRGG